MKKKSTLPRHIRRMAELCYESLNTPRSLTAYLLLRAGEWDQLASLRPDPSAYLDTVSGTEKFRRDAQASDLLRKFQGLPTRVNRFGAAVKAFDAAEEQCLRTNEFLILLCSQPLPTAFEHACRDILDKARKWVGRVLGPIPDSIQGRYGPGTSFELKGSGSSLADKFWTTHSVTPSAYEIFEHSWNSSHVARSRTALGLPHVAQAKGNRFTTVPKDCTTDRGICVEPLGNLYCQLGIGGYMKERLARIGIYVHRQDVDRLDRWQVGRRPQGQTIHQSLARDGSIDGEWATIDLSSASDTVSYQLVRAIMPPGWFWLLDSTRSPFTLMPSAEGAGQWVHLQKFSSMGNGYTFELETLIFCALIHAVSGLTVGKDAFVYGDDIIVPTSTARDILAVLQAFGFTPNPRKTFVSGPFRESCGGDYFLGANVRSFFFKEDYDFPCEWYYVHNELRRRALYRAARHIEESCVPVGERLYGPSRVGHCVLHHPDRRKWKISYLNPYDREEDGIHWIRGRVLAPLIVDHDRWGSEMLLSLALYGVSSKGISPRGKVRGLMSIHLAVS